MRVDKGNYSKPKNICQGKETITRMKRQAIEREKVFANHISDKQLIVKICKEHLQLNSKQDK